MSFFTSNFFLWVLLLISFVNSQSERKIQEMMKLDDRLSYIIDDIIQLQADLNRAKEQVGQLSTDLNQSKQLIGQLSADLNRSNEQNKKWKNEIEAVKQELSKLSQRDSLMKKSVSVTKPSIYFHLSNEYHTKEPDYTWTINTTAARMNRTKFELFSPVFPLKGYQVGGQVNLTLKGKLFYVSLAYKNLNGKSLEFNIAPNVHFTFKGQNTSDVTQHYTSPFKASLHYDTFYYERGVFLSPYEVIEVHVESPWASRQALSRDGSLTWVIDEYRKKRKMEEDWLVRYQLSPYFYTGPKGYRVQAYVSLNGYSKYRHQGISVTVDFVSGPYDKSLNASFPHRTTFTLLHPTDPSKHVVKSVDENIDDITWYVVDVGAHDEVEKLIDNDTLYYQIDIQDI